MSPPHALAPHDRDPVMEERGSPRPSALDGARIMIVEDEYFVAARLERSLEQEGATVVGVFATVETALAFAIDVLRPGGTFVSKVFAGGADSALVAEMKRNFATVKHAKPPASRKGSVEWFVVAQGFKGRGDGDAEPQG